MCVSKDKTLLYYIHQTTPLDGSGVFLKKYIFFGDLQNDTEPHTCLVKAGVDCSTMETVYAGFFSWYSKEPCHLKKTRIPQKWDTLNSLIKIIQRMLQNSHHPVFIVSLSSDDPNHMRGSVDLQKPSKEAGHPQPLLAALFSSFLPS